MIEMQSGKETAKADKDWQKTPYSNLIRYIPSGSYYARLRVKGKLIRRSLKTSLISVAKLRLSDFEKVER
jgi:iron-sulfur cluster repair protein YtfE (RIC family)